MSVLAGDLIKATRKGEPETTVTGRVQTVTPRGGVILLRYGAMWPEDYEFEVLDRAKAEPAKPEVPEELVLGAINAYRKQLVPGVKTVDELHHSVLVHYKAGMTAAIHFINEYHNKKGINA